jgi:hypothetical protein
MHFATATEYGVSFETGKPVEVRYIRSTKKAPPPMALDRYQQRIEPAGRYMLHNPEPGDLPPGWESGVVRFQNPLVIPFNRVPGNYYDQWSWKAELAMHYGKRGRALSRAIVRDGYDGIVTVMLGAGDTREIVDLTWFLS